MSREDNNLETKNRVLQLIEFPPVTEAGLAESFDVTRFWKEPDQESFLQANADDILAIATMGNIGVDNVLLDRLPNVRVVACFGVGVDAIDLNYAAGREIAVSNTPDVLTECVADMGMALMLALARGVVAADRFVREGAWLDRPIYPLTTSLGGKRLGVIGFGRIGQAVAKRAKTFGMKVAYHGPNRKPEMPYRYFDDPADLAAESDFLMLNCPGGAATHHLVDARVLRALGADGHLINISRGSVVDEAALIEALEQGVIKGAALDVYEVEPCLPKALLAMENVVLQPHHGSGTVETRKAMGDLVIANLRAFFAGTTLPNRVV